MKKSVELTLVVLATIAVAGGTATLLVFAQYSALHLVAGAALLLIGLGQIAIAPAGRRRATGTVLAVAILVTAGLWAVARFTEGTGTEPPAPEGDGTASTAEGSAAALAESEKMIRAALRRLDGVRDYTYTLEKRERAKSLLGTKRLTDEAMAVKIRHDPFSVYVKYIRPEARKGTEAIYVEGSNEGKLIAHSTRAPFKLLGTMELEPTDWRAMIDQRYPITMSGLRNMTRELLRLMEDEREQLLQCTVVLLEDETIDARPCRGFEIRNPSPDGGYDLAFARVLFDREWIAPVYYERWRYEAVDGEMEKRLLERYTMTDIRLDPGLEDISFDPKNPEYGY